MIRLATMLDLNDIWQLREETKALLKERGIDQWQHSNPSYETFIKDIELNELYVYEENGIILGMIAIKKGIEHTYDIIYEGTWGNACLISPFTDLQSKEHCSDKRLRKT